MSLTEFNKLISEQKEIYQKEKEKNCNTFYEFIQDLTTLTKLEKQNIRLTRSMTCEKIPRVQAEQLELFSDSVKSKTNINSKHLECNFLKEIYTKTSFALHKSHIPIDYTETYNSSYYTYLNGDRKYPDTCSVTFPES